MVVMIWGYFTSSVASRPFGHFLLLTLLVLASAGVGLDMAHAHVFFKQDSLTIDIISGFVAIAEDGTELVVGSFGAAGALAAVFWSNLRYRMQFSGTIEAVSNR